MCGVVSQRGEGRPGQCGTASRKRLGRVGGFNRVNGGGAGGGVGWMAGATSAVLPAENATRAFISV